MRVLADVLLADLLRQPVAPLLNLDRPEPVRVEPVLEAVDVAVGIRPRRLSVDGRKVGVEAVRRRLCLIDDDGGETRK